MIMIQLLGDTVARFVRKLNRGHTCTHCDPTLIIMGTNDGVERAR